MVEVPRSPWNRLETQMVNCVHSDWLSAHRLAQRLIDVGVDLVAQRCEGGVAGQSRISKKIAMAATISTGIICRTRLTT